MRAVVLFLALLCAVAAHAHDPHLQRPGRCGAGGQGTCVPFGQVLRWQRRGAACTGDSACDDPAARLPVQTRLCCVPRTGASLLRPSAAAFA